MDIDDIARQYIIYLKGLPESKIYKYAHGNYHTKDMACKAFMKQLNLSFTQFKHLSEETRYIQDYADLYMIYPPKKTVAKKTTRKILNDSDEEDF